jgi:sugar/nucleoside kinase (ribokinase family)
MALSLPLVSQVVPPFWTSRPPVDTCGAGDAYAAGMMFGWLSGQGLASMGRTAARAASSVIGRQGAAMTLEQAAEVAAAVAPVGILEAAHKAGVVVAAPGSA